jgi:hypothetical protein
MATTIEKPEGYTDEHAEYLNDLRESGATNMFGSPAYLAGAFGLGRFEARTYVSYWMGTFENA